MTRIIALSGFKSSGKGAVAQTLAAEGFVLVKFVDPLKNMLRAFGLSEREIEGDLKERPCDLLCGVTPRSAMQTLGTEWGRRLVHGDLWVNAWRSRALQHELVVVDDCRFPNEARVVSDLGGMIWRVVRPGYNGDGHESERHALPYDAEILNDGTLADLHARTLDLMVKFLPTMQR